MGDFGPCFAGMVLRNLSGYGAVIHLSCADRVLSGVSERKGSHRFAVRAVPGLFFCGGYCPVSCGGLGNAAHERHGFRLCVGHGEVEDRRRFCRFNGDPGQYETYFYEHFRVLPEILYPCHGAVPDSGLLVRLEQEGWRRQFFVVPAGGGAADSLAILHQYRDGIGPAGQNAAGLPDYVGAVSGASDGSAGENAGGGRIFAKRRPGACIRCRGGVRVLRRKAGNGHRAAFSDFLRGVPQRRFDRSQNVPGHMPGSGHGQDSGHRGDLYRREKRRNQGSRGAGRTGRALDV